jgi:hypothetical protein
VISLLSLSRLTLNVNYIRTGFLYLFKFLIVIFIFSPLTGRSQKIQEIKISGTLAGTPLSEFLDSIETNNGIKFFYKGEWIKTVEVTQSFNNLPLTTALTLIFRNKGLTYRTFQQNSVIIFPIDSENQPGFGTKESKILVIGDPLNLGRYQRVRLQGKISDGKNEETLAGAVIFNIESGKATTTDAKGRYTLELPSGDLHLRISFIGFEDLNQSIRLIQNGNADFELFESSHPIGEVTVVGDDARATRAQMSMIRMSSVTLKELPVLMGEADLIKSLVMMPGVQSTGEMSSGFNVRGGNTDQNLVLLNGAPVFNITHLFGFFSMINPDAVQDVTLYKGGIPAIYGERISSVMDIQMKEGRKENFGINGGIGLIDSRLNIEGPLGKLKKSSFFIGGRSTYSDWLLRQTRNPTFMNSVAHFYDLNGTANIEFSPKNHLKLMGYTSSDVFNLNSSSLYHYDNLLGSVNWKLNFSDKVISNFTLAYSKYSTKTDTHDPLRPGDDYTLNSNIRYGSIKYIVSLFPTPSQRINMGFQSVEYLINPGKLEPSLSTGNILSASMKKEQSAEMALFVDDDFDLTDKLAFNTGLRYTRFFNFGPGMVYHYLPDQSRSAGTITDSTMFNPGKIIKSYQGLEPRLAIKYSLENGGSIKLSYQRIHQFVNQVSNTAVISPADYWKLADPYIAPLINDQIALGFFKNPEKGNYEASAEIYYKKLQNLLEYKNGAQLILNQHIETDLLMARGYSYGIELLAKKNNGRLNGWVSYTYSRTLRKTDGRFADDIINGGKYYPSVYDKPHDLSAVMNYKISRRWRFSGNFVFSSGRPITLPEQKYVIGGNQVVYYSERNKYRMPPYNRMDVSITLDENLRKKRGWKGSWTLSVYNLYGRKNPYSVFYRKDASVQSTAINQYAIYELSIIGVPVPSITYNFKF